MLSRMWGKGTAVHCSWECKLVQPLEKTVQRDFRDPNCIDHMTIELLGVYPNGMKSEYERL